MVELNSTMQSRRLSRKRGKSLERSNEQRKGERKRTVGEVVGGRGARGRGAGGQGAGRVGGGGGVTRGLNEKEERRWRTKHGYRGTLSLEFHSEKLLLLGAERGPNIN